MAEPAKAKPKTPAKVLGAAAVLLLGLVLSLVACAATAIHGEALDWMKITLYVGMVVTGVGVFAMVAADGVGPAQH